MLLPKPIPNHLQQMDAFEAFRSDHPDAAALIDAHKGLVLYYLEHSQKPKEVKHQLEKTEIGTYFESWILIKENRIKFDGLSAEDKYLIIYSLNNLENSTQNVDWMDVAISISNKLTNDLRKYTGSKSHHPRNFHDQLERDGFMKSREITPEGLKRINEILGR